MKKLFFVFVGVFFVALGVHAQLIDVIGSSYIGSQVDSNTLKQINKSFKQLNYNDILNKLNLLISDIRMTSMGNYSGLKKENYQHHLDSIDWMIGDLNGNRFYIELYNVDKSSCNKLIDAITDALVVRVNSSPNKDCAETNSIRFVFE